MTASDLLGRALRLLGRDPGASVRIMAPALLTVLLMPLFERQLEGASTGGGLVIPLALLVLVFMVVALPWSAIALHRYGLRGESPGAIGPRWHAGRFGRYFRTALILGLIVLLPYLLVSLPAQFLLGDNSVLAAFLGDAVQYFCVLRLGLALPAAALDRKLGLGESWRMTAPLTGQILLVSMALALVPAALLVVSEPLSYAAYQLIWVVEIALMTVLYGALSSEGGAREMGKEFTQ